LSATDQRFFVYILRCADGSYYVGSTTDVAARVEAHNAGRGPRFTACRRPVTLVYTESFHTMDQARQRQLQIKKWSRAKKEALIAGDLFRLHTLSRRRS
jgi:putative endonuclease